jgi:hypothetical protein
MFTVKRSKAYVSLCVCAELLWVADAEVEMVRRACAFLRLEEGSGSRS